VIQRTKRKSETRPTKVVWNDDKVTYFKLDGDVWAVNSAGVPGQFQALPKYKQVCWQLSTVVRITLNDISTFSDICLIGLLSSQPYAAAIIADKSFSSAIADVAENIRPSLQNGSLTRPDRQKNSNLTNPRWRTAAVTQTATPSHPSNPPTDPYTVILMLTRPTGK